MAKADFYDSNPKYNYTKYWVGRDYENLAEEAAITRLLRGLHFKKAADIGGGYGRLCLLLQQFADDVTLLEPSKKQRELGADFLKNSGVHISSGSSDKTSLKDGSVDLLTMIRVMHHLPDPVPTFKELHRVLSDDGRLILEVANSKNFKSRLRRLARGKKTPLQPVDIRTDSTEQLDKESPFVNHNPRQIVTQLASVGFEVVDKRSVSNLRSSVMKKALPVNVRLSIEKSLQKPFSRFDFGPSVFYLIKKSPKA